MIKIFNENDRDFSTNGNIVINPIKCREVKKKSLNGWYVEVEVSLKYKEYIEQGKLCVVKTKSKVRPQAFRIENPKVTNNIINFTANHVMFDSKKYFLVDVRPTNQAGQNALSYINERTDKKSPFTIFSDVTTENTAYFIRKNLFEAWEIIEERWNGIFDADNWDINFLTKVGNDNGETVTYGKNMQGIEIIEDWSNVCTKIYPVGSNELMLDEKYLESDVQYSIPYTKTITFNSELEQNEEMTEEEKKAELIEELRKNAKKYLEENKYPKVCYEVTSNINQNMEIGDTIHVKHPLVNLITEVLEYEHNILTGNIELLVFGNYKRDVKSKFDSIKENINNVTEQLYKGLTRQDIVIQQQTDLINSLNKTGYVYIDENEILILDALPKENAKNVWRFGLGGIGFSSNGYEGPFELAMTMDGQINADFITTGTMSVARIEGLKNTLNDYLVSIQLNSTNIQQMVATQKEIEEKFGKYSTTEEMNSVITQLADQITTEVNKKVGNDEWGTKLQQSATDIQIAWNNISKYIQFINATLRIMDSSDIKLLQLDSNGMYLYDEDGSTNKMILNRTGQQFYQNGNYIGNIGTNQLKGYNDKKSLSFNLNTAGSYMTWACKDNPDDNIYEMKLWYARPNTGKLASGLALGTDLVLNGNQINLGNDSYITAWLNGGSGIRTKDRFTLNDINNITFFAIDEGYVNCYTDLDMHNWNIINANSTTSDGRLKKNIHSSKVKAIDRIMKMKLREFKWKKDDKQETIGYIAQELEKIDKTYVQHNYKKDKEGKVILDSYELRHSPLIATNSKAIQEQQVIIEEQEKILNKQQMFIEIVKDKLSLQEEYEAIFNDIKVQLMSIEENEEVIFEGDVVMETSKVLTPVPKYNTVMKYVDDDTVEIYQKLAEDSEV